MNIETYTVTVYETADKNRELQQIEKVSDVKIWGSEIRLVSPDGSAESVIMDGDKIIEVKNE